MAQPWGADRRTPQDMGSIVVKTVHCSTFCSLSERARMDKVEIAWLDEFQVVVDADVGQQFFNQDPLCGDVWREHWELCNPRALVIQGRAPVSADVS